MCFSDKNKDNEQLLENTATVWMTLGPLTVGICLLRL